ncbi:MAG: c-type cytochrome [Proteobacteria bacterium]|nr:c-type cytochrome [Pseudomonadota bacterium]
MKIRKDGWVVAAGLMALSAASLAAPPTAAMLSNACAGCHGTLGASAGPSMPSLAGQSKVSIVESMNGFKSGARPSTIMGRLAKGYSDAEIDAMGEFFSKQKPVMPVQTLDPAKIAKGQAIHEKSCARCHVEDGKEPKDNSPIVASQWLKYLQVQMDDYASGKRKMLDNKAEKMKPLSRDDLDAVAHFYSSIK